MKTEPNPNPHIADTILPALSCAELALAVDLACYWLTDAEQDPHRLPRSASCVALEGKYRDVQRLRMRLLHHQVLADREARRVPA